MKKIICAMFGLLFLSACKTSQTDSISPMAFDEVEYVSDFPYKLTLDNPVSLNIGEFGINNMRIVDGKLIMCAKASSHFWKVVNLDTEKVESSFFELGNSKEEFVFPPSVNSSANFYHKNDSLYVDAFDDQKGRLLTFNIQEILKENKTNLKGLYTGLSNDVFTLVRLSDGKYFLKTVGHGATQLIRSVKDITKDSEQIPKVFDKLNSISVKSGKDITFFSTMNAVGNNDRMVEVPLRLNYINIYQLDGSFHKTICVEDEMTDIGECLSLSIGEQKKTFSCLKVYGSFFGVLFLNEDLKSYQTGSSKIPRLMFFNLDGKPLAEVTLDRNYQHFDVDIDKGYIYMIDGKTDELLKYKMTSELMGILKSTK